MNLQDREVTLYLTTPGFDEIGFVFGLSERQVGLKGSVRETDESGIWFSSASLAEQAILVPWPFIAAVELDTEMERGQRKTLGF